MKFLFNKKDGGPESRVYMYGFESKRCGSLLLLRFEDGSRESYHSHAFKAWSWILWGCLVEQHLIKPEHGDKVEIHNPWSLIHTARETFHRVFSVGRTWVFTLRGPWTDTWAEYDPNRDKHTMLGTGREVLAVRKGRPWGYQEGTTK